MKSLTEDDLAQFLAEDPGGPVDILNLVRFRPDGGRERYQHYIDAVRALPQIENDMEWIYYGQTHRPLESDQQPDWHAVTLVRYVSRTAFVEATRSPAYQKIRQLRDDAIQDSVVQPTSSLLK